MSASGPGDTQRELEQRALRNVRGLVDKIEEDDKLARRTQWRIVAAVVAGIIVVLLGVLAMLSRHEDAANLKVPLKPGQVIPQAPKASQ